METATLPPTPPDKILAIALTVVAIFGAAEITAVVIHYVGRPRPQSAVVRPVAQSKAPIAASAPPQSTSAPVEQAKSAPVNATQSSPSTAALSAAERLLRDATVLRDQGDTTNALARLQEAAQSDPKNSNVWAQMAMIYESIQLYERSNETWQKIIDIGPSAGALYELAEMKVKQGIHPPSTTSTTSDNAAAPPSEAGAARDESDVIPEGSTFGITELSAVDTPDPDAETNMKLKISVKARPNTTIDHTKVKIQVFFYDTAESGDAVLTDADVSYEWLTPHHDWKDTNPEILSVTYLRPKNRATSESALKEAASAITPGSTKKKGATKKDATAELPGDAGHRKYLGYIVRIYYLDQLQAVRAEPTKLLNLFPPPFTAPQQ